MRATEARKLCKRDKFPIDKDMVKKLTELGYNCTEVDEFESETFFNVSWKNK